MKYFEVTVTIGVYAKDEQDAYDYIEGEIDNLVNESKVLQNYAIITTNEIIED